MLKDCCRLLALLLILPALGRAQGAGTVVLPSKAMNENRTVFIHTPSGYEQSSDSYPVLYLLDGDIPGRALPETALSDPGGAFAGRSVCVVCERNIAGAVRLGDTDEPGFLW